MFWEKWIPEKYLVRSSVCGLEVLVTDTGFKFYYSIVNNKNNKLSVLECGYSENELKLPSQVLKNKIPLAIAVVGKGLISKKIPIGETEVDYNEILVRNLPAINVNDFYIQFYPQDNKDAFLTIFRKEPIDLLLKLLKESKNEIAGIYLGYSFLSDVIPVTSLFERIVTNDATIEFSNSHIENVKTGHTETNGKINIDDVSLDKTSVLGFALAFIYLLNSEKCYNYNQLNVFKTYHLERNKFKILSRAAVGLAFGLCLINFLFFNYYFSANKKLESKLNLYEGKYEKINELLSSYEKKKHLIEEAGILNDNGLTQNIDKITSSIPPEVVLTDLTINPIVRDVEEDSLIKFKKNLIVIKGNCDKSLIVNEWVHVLKSQNFIKDVNLDKFIYRNEGNQPNFEINVSVE